MPISNTTSQASSTVQPSATTRGADGSKDAASGPSKPAASEASAQADGGPKATIAADGVQTKGGPKAISSTEAVAKARKATDAVMRSFDRNHDGAIDKAEFDNWIAKAGGDKASHAGNDANHDGKLSKSELIEAFAKAEKGPQDPTLIQQADQALKAADKVLDAADGALEAVKSGLDTVKGLVPDAVQGLVPGADALEASVKAADALVDKAKGMTDKAQELLDKAKPMAFSEQEKAQLEQAAKTLEKLAGADGVWDGADTARNARQISEKVREGVSREVDAQAGGIPIVRRLNQNPRTGEHRRFHHKQVAKHMGEGYQVAERTLRDSQREAGIGTAANAASRPTTAAGEAAGRQQISTAELNQFEAAMSLIESRSKTGGSFPNGMPVKFIRDVASDRPPIIPAGVKPDFGGK